MAEGNKSMNYIDLTEMFMDCAEFMVAPNNPEKIEKVEKLKKSLIIRPFVPMEQKKDVIVKTLYDINVKDESGESFIEGLEISLTFNALMAYIVNVDYDIPDFYKQTEFYDVFWGSGVADYVLRFCEQDFNRLKDMVYQAWSFSNLQVLVETVSQMDFESVQELTNSFKNFTLETSPETIKAIADIEAGRDPRITLMRKNIEDIAYDVAMKKVEKVGKSEKVEVASEKKNVAAANKIFEKILKK